MDANEKLQFTLRSILAAQEEESDCIECFDHLDQFVEMVQAGKDTATILPTIEAHLKVCHGCYGEYEALLTILRSDKESGEGK
jgi:hypothetical protein